MNLNPLKKDDNTDALVKALEDANNTANPAAVLPQDPSIIAPDPSAVPTGLSDAPISDGASTLPPVDTTQDQPVPDITAGTGLPTDPLPTNDPLTIPESADPTAGLSFDGTSELPIGLSSDADAHLPSAGISSGDGELDGVKKSALEQLRPLIEKLDLEPADKFDKYLMMLRASDDPALIKPAFDAAQGIVGEKEKAQALLDIINEINYITANQQQ